MNCQILTSLIFELYFCVVFLLEVQSISLGDFFSLRFLFRNIAASIVDFLRNFQIHFVGGICYDLNSSSPWILYFWPQFWWWGNLNRQNERFPTHGFHLVSRCSRLNFFINMQHLCLSFLFQVETPAPLLYLALSKIRVV